MGRAEKRAMARENRKMMSVGMAKTGIARGLQDGYRRGLAEAYTFVDAVDAAFLLAMRDTLGLGAKRMDAVRLQVCRNLDAMGTKDPDGEFYLTAKDAIDTINEEVYKGKMRNNQELCEEIGVKFKDE